MREDAVLWALVWESLFCGPRMLYSVQRRLSAGLPSHQMSQLLLDAMRTVWGTLYMVSLHNLESKYVSKHLSQELPSLHLSRPLRLGEIVLCAL